MYLVATKFFPRSVSRVRKDNRSSSSVKTAQMTTDDVHANHYLRRNTGCDAETKVSSRHSGSENFNILTLFVNVGRLKNRKIYTTRIH